MGVTQHCGGSDTSTAISNLLLVTGNYMRPGTGAYPLARTQQCARRQRLRRHADVLPGYQKVDDPAMSASGSKRPGASSCRPPRGWIIMRWSSAISRRQAQGDVSGRRRDDLADSNANHVQAAFGKLDFFVVQDIFFSQTCRFADVVLPAAPSLEKEGTFSNTERRIQRLYQVLNRSPVAVPTGRSSRFGERRLEPIGSTTIRPTSCMNPLR